MRPKFFLYCLFSRPSLLLRGPSYPKKSKTSDFIVTVGVSKWVHPTGIFLLDTCRMVSGTHTSWGHRFSMSIAIGKWLNKNSQRWYFAWENLQEVFVIFVVVSCSSFIVVLHLLLFLWCCFYISGLIHATGTPPWLLRPVKASTSSELYSGYFRLLLLFCLPRALRFWVSIFYPQAFFTLRCYPRFLTQPAFISRQFSLEVCRAWCLSLKHRPASSVCLIHSNPQPWYSEKFLFNSYQILSWITCDKKFSYLLLTRFELFSLVPSICKDYKKHSEQVLLISASIKLHIKVILKKQPPGLFT